MNILLAFLAFNLLVVAHELGHFAAAKLFGIKVLEFSLFVGPKLFQISRGETKYTLRMLPILAYVKMEGEEEEIKSERSFNSKSPWKRAAVIAAGPLMNLAVAVAILTVIFSYTGFATTEVRYVDNNSPAYNAGIEIGDEIIRYEGKRVYLPIDIIQFLQVSKGKEVNVVYVKKGERIESVLSPVVVPATKRYMFGFTVSEPEGEDSNVIKAVSPGSPAEKNDLIENDRIVKLNETQVDSKKNIDDFMADHDGSVILMTIIRNGQTIVKEINPELINLPEQYYLGMEFRTKKAGIAETFGEAATFTYTIVRSVAYGLVWLITGKASVTHMVGPVGAVSVMSNVVEQNKDNIKDMLANLFYITAMISIALGATNLIPFPALDGNKLLLLVIEAIRRKPIAPEKEALISMVGFVFLIALAVFIMYNDIVRLITGG